MNSLSLYITLILAVVSVACVLPGMFLVLRGSALMSDAISHTILPGILLMFLIVKKLNSPWLLLGASCAGLATVLFIEYIVQTKRVKKEAAIGLVYPLFFSLGVIGINLYTRTVHLDTDMVLLGELAFTPFDRFIWGQYDLGPCCLWVMGLLMLINSLCVWLFYKELVIGTCDPLFAQVMGCQPLFTHYMLMAMTSFTAVGAFNVVGSIIVVALMIVPCATAYLITDQVKPMLFVSILMTLSATLLGCSFARCADVSLAGSVTVAHGVLFLLFFLLSLIKKLVSPWSPGIKG